MKNYGGKKIVNLSHPSTNFKSIEIGKVDVKQQKVGPMLLGKFDRRFSGVSLNYRVTMLFEQFAQGVGVRLVVVNRNYDRGQ